MNLWEAMELEERIRNLAVHSEIKMDDFTIRREKYYEIVTDSEHELFHTADDLLKYLYK